MIASLRNLILGLMALSLVGYQTACACAHGTDMPDQPVAAHQHCDEAADSMAMSMQMPMHSETPELSLPCEHVASLQTATAASSIAFTISPVLVTLPQSVERESWKLTGQQPDRLDFPPLIHPPPKQLPLSRQTVFLI
ncbi:MAG: hypothetical protein CMK09_03670 [Ponticaulis sp.]|nr:hypothetical protein [Ponticaulis sp.]